MKKLIKIEEICSIALFLIILMILFWQIFSRKVLNAPASWSEELSRLLFVYMGILGCHLAQHYEPHIRIDFILSLFPKPVQLALDIIFKMLMAVIFILIAHNGIRLCRSAGVQDHLVTLGLPVTVLNFGLVFLGVIIAAEMLIQLAALLRFKKGGDAQ